MKYFINEKSEAALNFEVDIFTIGTLDDILYTWFSTLNTLSTANRYNSKKVIVLLPTETKQQLELEIMEVANWEHIPLDLEYNTRSGIQCKFLTAQIPEDLIYILPIF